MADNDTDQQATHVMDTVSILWNQTLNSSDSYWMLALSLSIFSTGYVYCLYHGTRYNKLASLHNFHNLTVIALGLAGLYFDNDDILKERTVGWFTLGYFVVDLVENVIHRDVAYSFHALACLIVGVWNFTEPTFLALRMESKACLMECSSPFLHLAQKTRKPLHFVLFALTFTLCRIVWLPVIMRQLYKHGIPMTDYKQWIILAFYGLNLFWWSKILKILIYGPKKKEKDDTKTE